jgi:PAS domain S-box-containing protein
MIRIGQKGATYLVLAAALILFIASLATAGFRLLRIDQDIAMGAGENITWAAAQGEVELLNLLDTLDRLEAGTAGTGRDAVARRLDLLWSRLTVLREGEVGARLDAIANVGQILDDAAATLAEIEPAIRALAPGDSAATAVKSRLRSLQPKLHEAAVWTLQSELERITTRDEARRVALLHALTYFLGLFAGAVILVLLLVREIRGAQKLAVAARFAEAEAKRSAQRFRDIVEAASDWVWETGPDHRLTFVSEQLLELSGERPEDILGRKRWDIRLPDDTDDDRWERHKAVLAARRPFRDFVFPYRDHGGRRHFCRIHGKPFFAADGAFLGDRGTGRDLTAELEAAQTIAESRRLLRVVIDAVPAVVNVKDPDSRYVLMNRFQAELYGVGPEEAIGKRSADLVGDSYGGYSQELDRQVVATGQALPLSEREFTDVHGARHTWWTAKTPLSDEDGRVRYVVTVALDITRLKQTERARNNLSRYFSPNMVELLAGADEAVRPVRSHKVAVLFADIVGFTRFFATEPPERVFAVLREFHARMARIVFAFDGTLDKYIGDGLMASFGTPRAGPLDAAHALRCACAMAQEIVDWDAARAAAAEPPVRIAIGAHYGPVLLGDIGDERRLEFAVIGDTVNIASRLEGLTRTLKVPVVVSDALVEAACRETGGTVADFGPFTRAGPQTIRGVGAPIPVWVLAEPSPRAG